MEKIEKILSLAKYMGKIQVGKIHRINRPSEWKLILYPPFSFSGRTLRQLLKLLDHHEYTITEVRGFHGEDTPDKVEISFKKEVGEDKK